MRSVGERGIVQRTHSLQRAIRERVGTRIDIEILISNRHGVREIRLERTLYLEHIRGYQVLRTRTTKTPTQPHITRHALLRIQYLLGTEIIDTVVSRNMNLVGLHRIALQSRVLRHIHAKGRTEETLNRICGRYDDHIRFLVTRHLRRVERSMVAHRFLENGILHRRVTVACRSFAIYRIEVRRE